MYTLRTCEPLQSWQFERDVRHDRYDTAYSRLAKNCRGGIYKLEDEPSLAFITTRLFLLT